MPELPEVETVRRGLSPVMEGARIQAVECRRLNLRFPLPEDFSARLENKTIIGLGRRAKYLLVHLDSEETIICHLGMSGSFRIDYADPVAAFQSRPAEEAGFQLPKHLRHDHVVFHLEQQGEHNRVTYNDPRRFGFMLMASASELSSHPALSSLGIEPTGNMLDGALLAQLLTGKKSPLKAALLDQRLIAGLGNIYVCEALWRAGLSPRRISSTLASSTGAATQRSHRLASAIRDVIAEAIEAGGSSLKDYVQADGSLGYFQHSFNVYGREGQRCSTSGCQETILRITQSGRSTFFCPSCQR